MRKKKRKNLGVVYIAISVFILVFIVFLFTSCGTDYKNADRNTVYVLKNGKVASVDIDSLDESIYDKKELKTYVKDLIHTYNETLGKYSLKQKSFEVKDNKAILALEYASDEVYQKINGVELYTGIVKEAKEKGYKFDVTFAKIVDGKAVTAKVDDFSDSEDYKVAIIKSNTKVVIPGKVCFVSVDHVLEVGDDYVIITDDGQLKIDVQGDETEDETQGSDHSVDEGELVSGDGTIIFDFGEENDSDMAESPYSDVLTYIIYQ